MREPEAILGNAETRRLLDFRQPVAVLLAAVLHFVTDDEDPAGIVARIRGALAPGSYLAISHVNPSRPEDAARVEEVYRRANQPVTFRGLQQIAPFFDGFELVDPGVAHVADWRPDLADPDIDRHGGHGLSWISAASGASPMEERHEMDEMPRPADEARLRLDDLAALLDEHGVQTRPAAGDMVQVLAPEPAVALTGGWICARVDLGLFVFGPMLQYRFPFPRVGDIAGAIARAGASWS